MVELLLPLLVHVVGGHGLSALAARAHAHLALDAVGRREDALLHATLRRLGESLRKQSTA